MNNYIENNNFSKPTFPTQQQSPLFTEHQTEDNNGLHPFYIFPFLYVVSIYFFPFLLQFKADNSILSYLLFLPLVFGIVNIIVSVKFCKPENRMILLNSTVLMKYALIPFFLFGGCLVVLCLCLSLIPVPFMIFLGPAATFLCLVIGWLILAFEAPYAISYLCASSKTNVWPKALIVIHSILQFFFTVDVIDVMVLTLREKKWIKLTIGIIVLLVLAVIALVVLFGVGLVKAL